MCLILIETLRAPPIGEIQKLCKLNCCLAPLYRNNWVKGMLSQESKLNVVHVSLLENLNSAHYLTEKEKYNVYLSKQTIYYPSSNTMCVCIYSNKQTLWQAFTINIWKKSITASLIETLTQPK